MRRSGGGDGPGEVDVVVGLSVAFSFGSEVLGDLTAHFS